MHKNHSLPPPGTHQPSAHNIPFLPQRNVYADSPHVSSLDQLETFLLRLQDKCVSALLGKYLSLRECVSWRILLFWLLSSSRRPPPSSWSVDLLATVARVVPRPLLKVRSSSSAAVRTTASSLHTEAFVQQLLVTLRSPQSEQPHCWWYWITVSSLQALADILWFITAPKNVLSFKLTSSNGLFVTTNCLQPQDIWFTVLGNREKQQTSHLTCSLQKGLKCLRDYQN